MRAWPPRQPHPCHAPPRQPGLTFFIKELGWELTVR